MRQHEEEFENLLELTEACDDAAFIRNVEYSHPRSDDRSEPKGFIRGNTHNGPVLEVRITKKKKHFNRHGIEIKIDSTQKDGLQSWIVISRSTDKYVTDNSEKKIGAATQRKVEELPEDIRVGEAGEDAGSIRKVSLRQSFVTRLG